MLHSKRLQSRSVLNVSVPLRWTSPVPLTPKSLATSPHFEQKFHSTVRHSPTYGGAPLGQYHKPLKRPLTIRFHPPSRTLKIPSYAYVKIPVLQINVFESNRFDSSVCEN